MVGENGFPETPDWSLPPRHTTADSAVTLATATLDGIGEN